MVGLVLPVRSQPDRVSSYADAAQMVNQCDPGNELDTIQDLVDVQRGYKPRGNEANVAIDRIDGDTDYDHPGRDVDIRVCNAFSPAKVETGVLCAMTPSKNAFFENIATQSADQETLERDENACLGGEAGDGLVDRKVGYMR
ncbi:hypothetical protein LTS18_005149 [Coniosporium uncinatum]|uniref:Uncharacterized protein n=1 Tax=Coniosporium uncinatum TaxID=93489 RepID=A0ACC3D5I3_9PEZI|nr:hypothetical protein LTS18_005149 [Coniosporium uncinatum]